MVFSKKGFTLLELVIVIAIIGILASIALIPNLIRFRERGAASAAQADMAAMGKALELSQAENCAEVGNAASGSTFCCDRPTDNNACDAGETVYLQRVPSAQASYLTYAFRNAADTANLSWFDPATGYLLKVTGFKAGGTFSCTGGACSCSGDCSR
jgi:type IV pilus assembly protein PilA